MRRPYEYDPAVGRSEEGSQFGRRTGQVGRLFFSGPPIAVAKISLTNRTTAPKSLDNWMDIDLAKTIGLGLTTAVVGSISLYQRIRRQPTPVKKLIENKLPSPEQQDLPQPNSSNLEEISVTVEENVSIATQEDDAPRNESQLDPEDRVESSHIPTIPFPDLGREGDELLTPREKNDVNNEDEEVEQSVEGGFNEEEDAGISDEASGDIELYLGLQRQNQELKFRLEEIIENQKRELRSLTMPPTPGGTRRTPAALLDEITRLRLELNNEQQTSNAAQDQLFSLQQRLLEKDRKLSLLVDAVMDGQKVDCEVQFDQVLMEATELRRSQKRASDTERKCLDLEAASIEQTSKLLDLREQLNASRLGKVQEVTELRKQLGAQEETFRVREAEWQAKVAKLEAKLSEALAKSTTPTAKEGLQYMAAIDRNSNGSHELVSAYRTPTRPSSYHSLHQSQQLPPQQQVSSAQKASPSKLRPDSSFADGPVVLSSTLQAVLQRSTTPTSLNSGNGVSNSGQKRSTSTPSSGTRRRSSSNSKSSLRNSASTNIEAPETPPQPGSAQRASRLSNYTSVSASGNKSVTTQDFLRMLNENIDQSGDNLTSAFGLR